MVLPYVLATMPAGDVAAPTLDANFAYLNASGVTSDMFISAYGTLGF
jgi:hypothetical protein